MLTIDMVLFSDFHAHNHTYGAKWVEFEGKVLSSRLVAALQSLREIRYYCRQHSIQTVLFGGDLFHTREAVKTAVYNMIVKELEAFDDDGITLIMIPGNHDMADREGLHHSLQNLEVYKHINVMDAERFDKFRPYTLPYFVGGEEGVAVFAVPYTEDKEKAIERLRRAAEGTKHLHPSLPTLLLAHQGVQGADLGADFIQLDEHDLSLSDVPLEAFTCAWFGHFHKHQRLALDAYYIGATEQHNWGDAMQQRGFIHLSMDMVTKKYSFKRVETSSPKFIHYYADAPVNVKPRKGDFVRVHNVEETSSEVKKSFEAVLGTSVELVAKKKTEEAAFVLQEEQLHANGLVDAWVDQRATSGYDVERLKTLGKRLLAKAESKGL